MCSGIAHDPLQRDIFTPLFLGAAVFIPTQDDITQPGTVFFLFLFAWTSLTIQGALAEWFASYEITVSCFTPAMGMLSSLSF